LRLLDITEPSTNLMDKLNIFLQLLKNAVLSSEQRRKRILILYLHFTVSPFMQFMSSIMSTQQFGR